MAHRQTSNVSNQNSFNSTFVDELGTELSRTGLSLSMPPLEEKKTPSEGSTLSSSDVYVADGDTEKHKSSDEEEEHEDVKWVTSTNVIANLQKRTVRSKYCHGLLELHVL